MGRGDRHRRPERGDRLGADRAGDVQGHRRGQARTDERAGARQVLSTMADAGFIELGGRRTPIKFAGVRPTGSGRLVTILTAEPILFLGGAMPSAGPRQGFEVAGAMLDVNDAGAGIGELAPAARVALDAEGALRIEDYGATVVWLQDLSRA